MGFSLSTAIQTPPPPSVDITDDSLAAFVHDDALDPDPLISLASLAVESIEHIDHPAAQVRAVAPQL